MRKEVGQESALVFGVRAGVARSYLQCVLKNAGQVHCVNGQVLRPSRHCRDELDKIWPLEEFEAIFRGVVSDRI